MVEGLYSAAAGMDAQQQQLDAISNDLANENTVGYQAQRVGFEDLLYSPTGLAGSSNVSVGAGAAAQPLGMSQIQGTLQNTGQPLDVALNGPGFIQVRLQGGQTGLTRDGQLQLNAGRQLTTSAGMLLQPPITVPAGTPVSAVKIATDGTVTAGSTKLGQLRVVTVPAPTQLTPAGANVYTTSAASGAARPAGAGTMVVQGSLEGSNVDMSSEMTQLISTQRSYSMDSEAISMQNQMLQIANEVRS